MEFKIVNNSNNLPKESITWLRKFGYCLNNGDIEYTKLKHYLKEHYPYEYYFFVDLDIKDKAGRNTKVEVLKKWEFEFKKQKRILIKKIYGLEKKSIK